MKKFFSIYWINFFLMLCFENYIHSQKHLGISCNQNNYLNKKIYTYSIGAQYYSRLSIKYKIILYRDCFIGISNYNKFCYKSNIITFLLIKYTEFAFKNSTTSIGRDYEGNFWAIFLSFLMPNGIICTKQWKNTQHEYGIIIAPFSYEYIRFPNNKELSNYVAEVGFPVFIHTKRNQHFSVQLYGGYNKNLASKNVRPENFENDNFSIRINFSYIWGVKKKNNHEEN